MKLLQDVDKAGSDVDKYVETLDQILASKVQSINSLRSQLLVFKDHLKQEELLSTIISNQGGGAEDNNINGNQEEKEDIGKEGFNLKEDEDLFNNDVQLLDNLDF
jgi:hypothetical protein